MKDKINSIPLYVDKDAANLLSTTFEMSEVIDFEETLQKLFDEVYTNQNVNSGVLNTFLRSENNRYFELTIEWDLEKKIKHKFICLRKLIEVNSDAYLDFLSFAKSNGWKKF